MSVNCRYFFYNIEKCDLSEYHVNVCHKKFIIGTNTVKFAFKNADFFNEQTLYNANLTVYLEKPSAASFEIFRKTRDKHGLSIYKKIVDFNESSSGWKSKDITEDLLDWLRFTHKNNTKIVYKVKFHCESKLTCFTANKMPFINIYLKSRPKRGIVNLCPPSDEGCCLRGVKVTVAQLGWESWFYLPKTFTYTYCAGSCKNQSRSLYGVISPGISGGKTNLNGCCVATKLKGLRVLHSLDDELYDKTINNIMADECSCVGL